MAGQRGLLISRVLLALILCALCLDSTQTIREQTIPEQTEQNTGRELIDMSIEELMDIPVMCDSDSTSNPVTESTLPGTGCA
jgi:hypothetical protein